MTSKSEAGSLSHPEPVAQEAVAWQWRFKGDMYSWHEGRVPANPYATFGSSWSGKEIETEERPLYLHPSPSPEQGEETSESAPIDYLTGRPFEKVPLWPKRDDARFLPIGDNHHNALKCPYCNPDKINPAAEKAARESAEAEISTLRARVAELEASATPQAGASEAEPVAWMRDYPDMTCLTTTKPEPPEPGWRDIWMPLYATPPDSDVVRAALSQLEEGLRNNRLCLSDVQQIVTATLSNQGSSSNGQ